MHANPRFITQMNQAASTLPANAPHYWSPRLCMLYFVAASTSLGTAVSALGRLALYACALCLVFFPAYKHRLHDNKHIKTLCLIILAATAYMALSIAWSDATIEHAFRAWTRHARLLTIPIMYLLIANTLEAKAVMRAFVIAQIGVVFSAWLLVAGVHVPWVTSKEPITTYAIFGSYLEQSMSQAVLIALLWFQRDWIFGSGRKYLAIAIAGITLVLTMGIMRGRSGQVMTVFLLGYACFCALPKRWRWAALVMPAVLGVAAFFSLSTIRDRFQAVGHEVTAYLDHQPQSSSSSSGERLVYWQTSLNAIAEKPLQGYGSGSWNLEYRRLEGGQANPATYTVDNPHQLFLLWAVEGGLIGVSLLILALAYLYIYAKKMSPSSKHSLRAVVIALCVSSMLNSMIFGIGMGDFFCIALGILIGIDLQDERAKTIHSHAKS
jgi:O-antigen ligase